MKVVFIFVLLSFLPLFLVQSSAQGNGLTKLTFIPQWIPQAQFAGYYMAKHKGIYRKYGIDLTIIDGGPERPSDIFLKEGKADFATMWLASAIVMRAKGVRIVNIGQMIKRSALMLVAKKSSGIRSPQDLDRKKVGVWGGIFQVQPMAFFKKFNIHPIIVKQSFSLDLFLRGGVDAASAMWYNEYHTILMSGVDKDELTTFMFSKYGLNFPEDGIYTTEDYYKKFPSLCRRFVKASIEGWRYAFAHPDETLDLVVTNLRNAHIPANRVHQRWMLERMKDLMISGAENSPMGVLSRKDYQRVVRLLKRYGLIETAPEFKEFYYPCVCHEDN